MHIKLLENLIETILFDKICEIQIFELVEKINYYLILISQKWLKLAFIFKKENTILTLSTIIKNKSYLEKKIHYRY